MVVLALVALVVETELRLMEAQAEPAALEVVAVAVVLFTFCTKDKK
jgi:hypothetical protein